MCYFFKISQGAQVNEAACDLAREVANEGDALVAGGVSQTPSYLSCKSETEVKAIFKKQMDIFIKKNVDFLIAEVKLSCHAMVFNKYHVPRFNASVNDCFFQLNKLRLYMKHNVYIKKKT